jgi:pantetheine-phosphate adenylyltransferase
MSKNKAVAVYPGTFDPITKGHIDIIKRALHIFKSLTVAVAENTKKSPLFTLAERIEMVKEAVAADPGVLSVEPLPGLLIDYMQSHGAKTIIRGLRVVSDFEYEFQMAMMNRTLNKDIDTVFLMPSEEHFFLSSTLVREVAQYGGDVALFVPKSVLTRIHEKWREKR